jgi:cysteine desulfurase
MKQYIYADNAATTHMDVEASQAMIKYLEKEYGNASQVYSFAREAKMALKEARESIAKCINADPDEIYFTSGGSESDNWAIKGTMLPVEQKNTVVCSNIEHHAVLNACEEVTRYGCEKVELHADKFGVISGVELENVLTDNTKLISVMMVNNEIGTIEPIKELAVIAHRNHVDIHTDAVQAVGHMVIDVKELGVDYLSASAHKFNGPKGVGFLYIKKGKEISPLINGGMQEQGLRAGTENVAGIVGMAVALKRNCDELIHNMEYIRQLEEILLNYLVEKKIDFIRNGINHIPGNISLSFAGVEGEMLLHRLDLKRILVSTGSACDSKNVQLSHIIQAIGVDAKYATGTIRISLSKDNTQEEVTTIAEAIVDILRKN